MSGRGRQVPPPLLSHGRFLSSLTLASAAPAASGSSVRKVARACGASVSGPADAPPSDVPALASPAASLAPPFLFSKCSASFIICSHSRCEMNLRPLLSRTTSSDEWNRARSPGTTRDFLKASLSRKPRGAVTPASTLAETLNPRWASGTEASASTPASFPLAVLVIFLDRVDRALPSRGCLRTCSVTGDWYGSRSRVSSGCHNGPFTRVCRSKSFCRMYSPLTMADCLTLICRSVTARACWVPFVTSLRTILIAGGGCGPCFFSLCLMACVMARFTRACPDDARSRGAAAPTPSPPSPPTPLPRRLPCPAWL
mmetsp:Transcript_35344/g.92431  ORF Transcript_35344/g.92431 Transcript_35344/m.92431 type:complete len:313 (-) Transcript_35344:616-1554(-)